MSRSPVHVAAAALYAIAVLAVATWPTPVDRNLDVIDSWPVRVLNDVVGLAPSQGYDLLELGANVLLFVPLGWLAVALVRRAAWWAVTLAGGSLSVLIELSQQLVRPERHATLRDVVANTLGVLLGAVAARLLLHREAVRGH